MGGKRRASRTHAGHVRPCGVAVPRATRAGRAGGQDSDGACGPGAREVISARPAACTAARPTTRQISVELFRVAVGPVLLLVTVPAGLAGCAARPGPELVVPPVFYVPRDAHSATGSTELRVTERQAADVPVTFGARGLDGVAILPCEGRGGAPAS